MTLITRPFIAPTGPLSLTNIMEENQSGLSSIFNIKCSFCSHLNEVKSSAEHRAGSRGPLVNDINTRAVLGSLHAGMGNTSLGHLLHPQVHYPLQTLWKKTKVVLVVSSTLNAASVVT